MFDLLNTAIRYFFLAVFGYLVNEGVLHQSLTEPLIGLALALFAIFWYWYSKLRKPKSEEVHEHIDKDEP